jgi:hypothetical protein
MAFGQLLLVAIGTVVAGLWVISALVLGRTAVRRRLERLRPVEDRRSHRSESPRFDTPKPRREPITVDPPNLAVPSARTVTARGIRVELDLSDQILSIDAPLDKSWTDGSASGASEAPIFPTFAEVDSPDFVSAALLAQKSKVFDDGLYAAVELAAQEGCGRHRGKAWLLTSVSLALAETGEESAAARILAAMSLGHVPAGRDAPGLEQQVARIVDDFLADEGQSKPIGFYTWAPAWTRIFQQDRLLQAPMSPSDFAAVTDALRIVSASNDTYQRHLRLIARLTNPPDPDPAGSCVLPPSATHEGAIMKTLFGDRIIPEGFVLADEMIRRIRAGELDLTPRGESGWYDHQTWALEPLVIPEKMSEGTRLRYTREYREVLEALFKGLLTLTRETHVKQVEIPICGSAMGSRDEPIDIVPALEVEPLSTHYLRRAMAYRFVRDVLAEAFGGEQLEQVHRQTESGPAAVSLEQELAEMEALFVGAHVTVNARLGLRPDDAAGSDAAAAESAERFATWARDRRRDPDLAQDLRAMVPVFFDQGRNKWKVWIFLGWSHRPVTVSFAQTPTARILDESGLPVTDPPAIRWGRLHARIGYPVTAEVYVDRLLDRHEFRALCDAHVTQQGILDQFSR